MTGRPGFGRLLKPTASQTMMIAGLRMDCWRVILLCCRQDYIISEEELENYSEADMDLILEEFQWGQAFFWSERWADRSACISNVVNSVQVFGTRTELGLIGCITWVVFVKRRERAENSFLFNP